MMQSWIRRLTGIAAACVSTLCTIPLCAAAPAAGSDGVQAADLLALNDAPDYMSYLAAHAGASRPSGRIVLTSAQVSGEEGSRRVTGYLDARQEAVLTEEGGYVEYTFDVEEAGFYTITAKFCVPEGRHTAAERDILVNGELPYAEAAAVTFKRRWVNSGSIRQDTRGNDIRPIQEEEEGWQCRTLTDPLGYHAAPLTFYFEQGRNTLRFDAVREPLILEALILEAPQELPSYAELAATYESKGYADGTQTPITLQGEDADIKSDQTLAPASDRSSPATVPSSPSKIRLNTIGGESFAQTGQFITWKFEVTQAGLYTFAFKWRQNIQRGLTSVRRVILDNEVPCAELNQVEFPYGGGWNLDTLGDGTSDYRFFLDEGWHEITLEVTLGDMGKVVRLAQHSMEELNRIYRRILMITGSTPDINRDYHFEKLIAGDLEALAEQAAALESICDEVEAITGSRGANVASVTALARQCLRFSNKPEGYRQRVLGVQNQFGRARHLDHEHRVPAPGNRLPDRPACRNASPPGGRLLPPIGLARAADVRLFLCGGLQFGGGYRRRGQLPQRNPFADLDHQRTGSGADHQRHPRRYLYPPHRDPHQNRACAGYRDAAGHRRGERTGHRAEHL